MAKKLKKAQYGIDPGFSKPGRSTNTPSNNDPKFGISGRNTKPVNDPGFSRPSKKDFIRGVAEGIVDSAKPKRSEPKTMDDFIKELNKNKKREDYLEYYKKGGPVTALDQVQRMYSKKKK